METMVSNVLFLMPHKSHNIFDITDNISVNTAIVYVSAILFALAVFPVHILHYAYVSTMSNYASVNITLYGVYTVLNFNTDDKLKSALKKRKKKLEAKKQPTKDEKDKTGLTPANWVKLYNKICITKIIQLADFGIQNENNVYIALAQKALTDAVYTFVKVNGGSKTKLKNYAILNYEHEHINYYLKLVGVINAITLGRLVLTFFWEKFKNEYKIKKIAKRHTI